MYAGQILVSGRAIGVIDVVVGEAEAAMPDSASSAPSAAMPMGEFGDLGGRGGASGRGFGGGPYTYTGGRGADPRGMESYIRERAIAHGIDPDVAMQVAAHEGLSSFSGDNNSSFGAFQLHVTHGGGAVGDNFRRDTGLDPSDPKNEKATIDYAMAHVAKHGWGAWMGARAAGITGMTGTGRSVEELRKSEEGHPAHPGKQLESLGSGIPSEALSNAAGMIARGGNSAQLKSWMAHEGHPQNDNWCADFVSAVLHAEHLPTSSRPSWAASYHDWGKSAAVPQAGDVLSRWQMIRGHGHAAMVESYDASTGTVHIVQGNPAARYTMSLEATKRMFDIRHMEGGTGMPMTVHSMADIKRDVEGGSGTPSVPQTLSNWVALKENFTPTAFSDYGQTNIGYGTAAHGRTSITEPEARTEMNAELAKHLVDIDHLNPNLPAGVRVALASLAYNTGWIGKSTDKASALRDAVRKGDMEATRRIFLTYTHAGGVELPGLVTRRKQEARMFDDIKYAKEGTSAAQDWGGKQAPEAMLPKMTVHSTADIKRDLDAASKTASGKLAEYEPAPGKK